jgi:hypothetical protein
MTPINLRTPLTSPQASPLALVFPLRRLLTEKSSITAKFSSTEMNAETLKIRATKATTILREISGYRHYGINE